MAYKCCPCNITMVALAIWHPTAGHTSTCTNQHNVPLVSAKLLAQACHYSHAWGLRLVIRVAAIARAASAGHGRVSCRRWLRPVGQTPAAPCLRGVLALFLCASFLYFRLWWGQRAEYLLEALLVLLDPLLPVLLNVWSGHRKCTVMFWWVLAA